MLQRTIVTDAPIEATAHDTETSSTVDEQSGPDTWWPYLLTGGIGTLILVAVAILVWQVADTGGADDRSFDLAEQNRMLALDRAAAPTGDGSFDAAETSRFGRLAAIRALEDGSSENAELRRMRQLAPTPASSDGSYNTAEALRMSRLGAATTNGDDSWHTAEHQRMRQLAPTPASSDGSHDTAEAQRMRALDS